MALIIDNPIIRREGVPRFWRSSSQQTKLLLAGGLVVLYIATALLSYHAGAVNSCLVIAVLTWLWAVCAVLVVPARAAQSIVRERLLGTWESLLLSKITAKEIIWGKTLAALLPVWVIGFLLLLAGLVVASIHLAALKSAPLQSDIRAYMNSTIVAFLAATGWSFFQATCGLSCSLTMADIRQAMFMTYCSTIVSIFCPLLAPQALHILRGRSVSISISDFFSWINDAFLFFGWFGVGLLLLPFLLGMLFFVSRMIVNFDLYESAGAQALAKGSSK